jgi:hypothetical protein
MDKEEILKLIEQEINGKKIVFYLDKIKRLEDELEEMEMALEYLYELRDD